MEREEEKVEVDEIDLRFCLFMYYYRFHHVDMQK